MDWPGRALLIGLAALVVGGSIWLSMAKNPSPKRTSEDRWERWSYSNSFAAALTVTFGPPFIVAGLAGLAGASPTGAWFAAAIAAIAEILLTPP